jgi:hypothetical protein
MLKYEYEIEYHKEVLGCGTFLKFLALKFSRKIEKYPQRAPGYLVYRTRTSYSPLPNVTLLNIMEIILCNE